MIYQKRLGGPLRIQKFSISCSSKDDGQQDVPSLGTRGYVCPTQRFSGPSELFSAKLRTQHLVRISLIASNALGRKSESVLRWNIFSHPITQMANQVHFYEPDNSKVPIAPKAMSIDFNAGPKAFQAQFSGATPPNVPLVAPTQTLQQSVLASLFNCGYGATPSELGLPVTQGDWANLQAYLRARLFSLLALLPASIATPSATICSPVIDCLEATEKIHMAFVLGGVFCHIGASKWVDNCRHSSKISRFWHRDVAEHAAVLLGQTANPTLKGVLNPDYLMELDSAVWSAVEAKGGFGDENWKYLRDGLKQAAKLESIDFLDLSQNIPNCQTHSIQEFICVQTWFRPADGELQVTVVDPPREKEKLSAEKIREGRPSTMAVKEFGDLIRAKQACIQFEAFGASGADLPNWTDTHMTMVEWRLLWEQKETGPIYLGIPIALRELNAAIELAAQLLSLVVPACRRGRDGDSTKTFISRRSSEMGERYLSNWAALTREVRMLRERSNASAPEFDLWHRAEILLVENRRRLRRDGNGDVLWIRILTLFAMELNLPAESGWNSDVLSLCGRVRAIAEAVSRVASIEPRLDPVAGESEGLQLSVTDHGLLLARGDWNPRDEAISKPLSKI